MRSDNATRLALCILTAAAAALFAAAPARGEEFDRKACEQAIGKQLARMDQGVRKGPYKADWKSLAAHTAAPEWFRDAKVGIYFHWGVYTVPAYGNEWYPKWMHTRKGRRSYYKHHVETYGEPDKFGYHDFVPKFRAQHFDADEWAELFAKAGAKFLAYYFNNAKEWGKDVVVTTKGHDYPPETAVQDFEKGRMDRLTDFCWLTDDTISTGSWCYTKSLRIKPASEVVRVLIDIVSKNGCLLLNISPKSDGTIPDNQREVLLALGSWLEVNGEAIYNTRPWLTFGEGPTRLGKGGGFVRRVRYSGKDIRYSRSKDGRTVYAVALGWPRGETLTLTAVQVDGADGGKVALLGCDKPVTHRVNDDKQLVIDVPKLAEGKRPCRFAYTFELAGFQTSLSPKLVVAPAPPAPARRGTKPPRKEPVLSTDLTLDATEAGLTGPTLFLEQKVPGQTNIGRWNAAAARVRWKVRVPKAGAYAVRAVIATRAPSKLAVEAAGQTIQADLPATGEWDKQQTIEVGRLRFDKPGEYEVVARPADPATWKAVNLWKLELTPAK